MNDSESSAHALLVTHLPLTNLRRNAHGTFRRLCTIAQAMHRDATPLVVVTTLESGAAAQDITDTARAIEQDLRILWGVEATVRLAVQSPPSRQRWIVQQLSGLISYGRTPSARTLVSEDLLAVLKEEIAKRPRFVVAHRLPSMFAITALRGVLPRVYFDMDDIEHVVWRRAIGTSASLRQKLFLALSLPALMAAERRAVRGADKTFVCSQADALYLRSLFSTHSIDVLPNATTIPERSEALGRDMMLMVGAYTYGPNADGANFFIDEVLPLIRAALPKAELWLVGAGSEALASFKASPPNVRFLGFVDDLAAVYKEARLVICPIRYGGGTRVKLIEAAAWGKPIVTTTIGAEGLSMRPGSDALFADLPQDFANACLELLRNDALCKRLGANARALAVRDFDRERIVARLSGSFREHPVVA